MESSHTEMHPQNKDGCFDIVNIDEPQRESIHVVSIKEMLEKLHPITEECSIYRVSKRLHNINHMAYTPQAISIGPFYHGQQNLMAMEQLKLRFLNSYLFRVGMNVEAAFEIAQGWETRARECYAEPINMNSDDFVKMMLVDGCFLVEFVIMNQKQTELCSSVFGPITTDLYHDFIMLENQLPFFILECLFDKYKSGIPFIPFAYNFCKWYTGERKCPEVSTKKVNHLVDLLSFYYALPTTETENNHELRKRPPTATELCEAGVEFQKATKYKHIMDICFQDGVLKIPPLNIHNAFETYVRNLLAFEHYHKGEDERRTLQYVYFLDDLISTERDVSLLVKVGIITNNIGGNNEDVSKLFNDLCKEVNDEIDFNYYNEISRALHQYCETRWHRSMASLRRDYFNTPWAFISFLGATFLILLTVMQAVYAALTYSK